MTQATTQQTPASLKHWQIATDALAIQATGQLANQLAALDWSSPGIATVIKGIYGGIVTGYRNASSVLSLQMYGDLRQRAEIDGRFKTVMAPDASMDWIGAKVDSAFKVSNEARQLAAREITAARATSSTARIAATSANIAERTTSDLATEKPSTLAADEHVDISGADLIENVVSSRLENSMQRMVASGGRETVAMTAAANGDQYTHAPTKPGAVGGDPAYYVRVPTSMRPCAFCVMMATRDADWRPFKSEASAGTVVGTARGVPRGKQDIGDRYHDHCQCIAVPVFAGKPPVFDRQPYFDMYDKAAANVGVRDAKKILAAMRQMYGLA
ncbi:MuF minor capsid protein [Mycobacterium phage prophi91-3]|uniref:VG15 protein n=1 Tax=Mycobacteroides abscessus TaxID=36809 RepID=UPI0019D09039|nr:hypothetical protein [Mycobacteroides abscessus]QSM88787.1 hypothetical protein I3U44_24130 [Mycobacteroides abscessus subsp. bolletii]QST90039.1 MuF minor capsid protein [Mycobacterium phage prophi91-3]